MISADVQSSRVVVRTRARKVRDLHDIRCITVLMTYPICGRRERNILRITDRSAGDQTWADGRRIIYMEINKVRYYGSGIRKLTEGLRKDRAKHAFLKVTERGLAKTSQCSSQPTPIEYDVRHSLPYIPRHNPGRPRTHFWLPFQSRPSARLHSLKGASPGTARLLGL